MRKLTFKQEQAHYEKVSRSNYLANLRIAGFNTSLADVEKPLSTREEAISKYLQNASPQFCPTLSILPDEQ